jgi:hypothetical protein
MRYELGFYIPEGGILHSHRRENLKSYMLESFSVGTFQLSVVILATLSISDATLVFIL